MKPHTPNTVVQTSIDVLEFSQIDPALQKLYDLQHRFCAFFEDPQAKLHFGFNECIYSYESLLFVLNRLTQEERMNIAELNLLFARKAPGKPEPRPMTPEEEINADRQSVIHKLTRLDIESFYIFSKHVLDRSADLFKFVFGLAIKNLCLFPAVSFGSST